MSNREDELETRVAELESTVRGLTQELVETKDRLKSLEPDEDEGGMFPIVDEETNGEAGEDVEAAMEAESVEADKAEEGEDTTNGEAATQFEDEIIIA